MQRYTQMPRWTLFAGPNCPVTGKPPGERPLQPDRARPRLSVWRDHSADVVVQRAEDQASAREDVFQML